MSPLRIENKLSWKYWKKGCILALRLFSSIGYWNEPGRDSRWSKRFLHAVSQCWVFAGKNPTAFCMIYIEEDALHSVDSLPTTDYSLLTGRALDSFVLRVWPRFEWWDCPKKTVRGTRALTVMRRREESWNIFINRLTVITKHIIASSSASNLLIIK